MTKRAIGIMDSGLGGLSVWQELVKIMPDENYIYFGDSGFCPYGSKDPEVIISRVKTIIDFFIDNKCKMIIVACNAITASAIDFLRKNYSVPFIGMEPAIKPALTQTKTGSVGVLATERALKGELFNNTKAKYAKGMTVIEQAGIGLVEKVEELDFESESTLELLRKYIYPMLEKNIDFLVLGCTHYPFLQGAIRKITGDKIAVIDPAPAVARHALNMLKKLNLKKEQGNANGSSVFYTTGDAGKMRDILSIIREADYDVRIADV